IEDSFFTELDLDEAANVLGGLGADYSAAYGGYSSASAFGAAIANENQRANLGGYDVSGVDPYYLAAKSRNNVRRISNDDYYLYMMGL
ncbi:MAG: hypothetical protein ACRC80_28995, partial [Waterburya sp.]